VNFPFICSNIPATPAYGAYISQMIRYSRACGSYQDFLDRGLKRSLKIPKGQSESVYRRRTDNTMAKQKKKYKWTNNDLQIIHIKLKIEKQ
jgi:hypothetical protein